MVCENGLPGRAVVRALPDARGCGPDVYDTRVGRVHGEVAHAPTDDGRSHFAPLEERHRVEALLHSVVLSMRWRPKEKKESRGAAAQ